VGHGPLRVGLGCELGFLFWVWAGLWELGLNRVSWADLLGWFSFSNFNSISYFYFKQSLNSNKNLNSNHTQTIKTMHQHECNTKIKPMIKF